MFLAILPNGCAAAVNHTLLFASATGAVARATFAASVTGLSASGESLTVLSDDKTLSSVSCSGAELAVTESQTMARRGSALGVFPAPAGAGSAGARVAVVGDKTGDATALGPLPTVRARKRVLLGHTGSVITAVALVGVRDELLLTGDRDGKIRASSWVSPWRVPSFLLGHTRAVSGLAPLSVGVANYGQTELIASAGGDGALRLWHARSGTLLHSTYFRFSVGAVAADGSMGAGPLTVETTPAGVAHTDADTTFSKTDDGGVGGPSGVDADAGGASSSDDGDGAEGAFGGGAADTPRTAPPSAVPPLDVSRGCATLSPLVVPASLVAFSGGADLPACPLIACIVVGELAVRVFAAVGEPSARIDVPHEAYAPAVRASGAGSDASEGGSGRVSLAQVRLLAVGTLRAGPTVPLALVPWSDGARAGLLFGGLFPTNGGDASSGKSSEYRVTALRVEVDTGISAGSVCDVGSGWTWEADSAAGAAGGAPRWRLVPSDAPPAIKAISDALAADTPSGLDASAVAREASPITANPDELDKASWAKPSSSRRKVEA